VLNDALAVTTIPVEDLERARRFYEGVLGLGVIDETPASIRYRAGSGSQISTYRRPPVARGHTVAHFEVSDIEAEVALLRSRGAVFEEYTQGPLITVNGIAPIGPARGAWLKDPDGNVIGLREGPVPG